MSKTFTIFLIAAGVLCAEEGRLTGPAPGLVFDRESRSIRLMLGVPGSAHLGSDIAVGTDAASVSPNGDAALIVRGDELVLLRGLETPSSLSIEGAIRGTTLFAWNADGDSAILYSAASRRAQIVSKLNTAPAAGAALDLASLEGVVNALAFDGSNAALAAAGGIYRLNAQGETTLLARASDPVAPVFSNQGRDVIFADRSRNEIWEIRDWNGSATPTPFADERAGVNRPAGVQVSRNGRRLLVANAGTRSVDAFDLATRELAGHVDLEFEPVRLESFSRGSLALLNFAGAGDPLYILDSSEPLAVYFVPAGREQ